MRYTTGGVPADVAIHRHQPRLRRLPAISRVNRRPGWKSRVGVKTVRHRPIHGILTHPSGLDPLPRRMNLLLAVLLTAALVVGPGLLPLQPGSAGARLACTAGALTAAALVLIWDVAPTVLAGETVIAGPALFPSARIQLFRSGWTVSLLLFGGLILVIGLFGHLYARDHLAERKTDGSAPRPAHALHGCDAGRRDVGEPSPPLRVLGELTSLSSFLLVGYWNQRQDARKARAWRSRCTATAASRSSGVHPSCIRSLKVRLPKVLAANQQIITHSLYTPMLLLVLLGRIHEERPVPVPLLAARRWRRRPRCRRTCIPRRW